MTPALRRDYRRAGPLPTLASFCAGVIGLVWGALTLNWLLIGLGLFIVLGAVDYYVRVLRHVPPMDEAEARAILETELSEMRSSTYAELIDRLGEPPEVRERIGASGACYKVEVQVCWDSPPGADLRVSAAIHDGGWRVLAPLTEGFTLAPDAGS